MTDRANLDIVAAFHRALNAQDVAGVLALAAPDVTVGGPRGSGQGHDLLREWVGRANITLEPRRVFARGGVVVVEQEAVWHDAATGEPTSRQRLATAFHLATAGDGEPARLTAILRYGDLGEALTNSGLDEDDAVAVPEGS